MDDTYRHPVIIDSLPTRGGFAIIILAGAAFWLTVAMILGARL